MEDQDLTEWLSAILRKLVSKPDELKVERTDDEQGVLMRVKVAQEDRGRVIGKNGSVAIALRTLLRSAGFVQKARISLKFDIPAKEPPGADDDY